MSLAVETLPAPPPSELLPRRGRPLRRFAGRYRIVDTLERGERLVYAAVDSLTHLPVTVELLHGDVVRDRSRVMRFQRQAELARQVSHPQLVRVLETGMVGCVPYLVMLHGEGESLAKVLTRQTLSALAVLRMAEQIANGVIALHDAGILHRGLEPRRIILSGPLREPRAMVAGFSSSRASDLQAPVAALGFLAPEQILGERTDARTDVYALGMLMHAALTGRSPFDTTLRSAAMAEVAITTAPAPSWYALNVPESLDCIVATATRKNRDGRYPSMLAMRDDLERALLGALTEGVQPTSSPDRYRPETDRGGVLLRAYRQRLLHT